MPLTYQRAREVLPCLHGRHKSYGARYTDEVKEMIADGRLTLVDNHYRATFPGLSAHQRLELETLIARADKYAAAVSIKRALPRHLREAASSGIRTRRDDTIGALGTCRSLDQDDIATLTGWLRDVLPPNGQPCIHH